MKFPVKTSRRMHVRGMEEERRKKPPKPTLSDAEMAAAGFVPVHDEEKPQLWRSRSGYLVNEKKPNTMK